MEALRIVFMGTPEFAVTILNKLIEENIHIVGVITAPDKPAGRGQKLHQSAVKKYALEKHLNILQPTNLKDPVFHKELSELNADLFVVVAFRMLPEEVWAMPSLGTINLHASLLPQYRGAAPINWAVINGEKETGVSTFFIEKEIDTGDIIEQAKVTIGENESAGELYERLMQLGAEITYSTVLKIARNDITPIEQDEILKKQELKPAPKLFKNNCQINFNQTVEMVHNFCRGLSPYPGAWCTLRDNERATEKTYKLFETRKTSLKADATRKLKRNPEGILIPCADYYLSVREIQPEGKRKMTFKEFLAGNSVDQFEIIFDSNSL